MAQTLAPAHPDSRKQSLTAISLPMHELALSRLCAYGWKSGNTICFDSTPGPLPGTSGLFRPSPAKHILTRSKPKEMAAR